MLTDPRAIGKRDKDGAQLGSPRRLRTLYQTNLQSAFMAARVSAAMEASQTHPYWMYVAVMDGETRHSHAQMHGKVFRYDDPIWQHIVPTNGFGCRCQMLALSEEQLKQRGLTVESSAGKLSEIDLQVGVDKQTGEVHRQRTTVYQGIGRDGRPFTFHADGGFDASLLQNHLTSYSTTKRCVPLAHRRQRRLTMCKAYCCTLRGLRAGRRLSKAQGGAVKVWGIRWPLVCSGRLKCSIYTV